MKKSTSIILIAVLVMLNFSTVKASEITSNFDDSILGGEKKVESTILNETEEIPQQENEMTESGIISNTQQNSKENEEEEIDQENKEIFSEIIQEENTTKSVQSGWVQQDGKWFYYDINGNKLLGWQYIGRDWYYFEPTDQGVMLYDCEKEILGKTYYFGNSGAMERGLVQRPEGWYFTEDGGSKQCGWQKIDGKWHYFDQANQGIMVYGCEKEISGKTYFFDEDGVMKVGWIQCSEGWYYAEGGGVKQTGWQYIGNDWYYFDEANEMYPGVMICNCEKEILGKRYFFGITGAMEKGWIQRAEGWYYAEGGGVKQTGWQYIGSNWYYFDENNESYPGLMVFDCEKTIYGKTYYFTVSGAMRVGWYWENGGWSYYDDNSGQKISGWKNVSGYWYYFFGKNDLNGGPEGQMAVNITIGDWNIGADGKAYQKNGIEQKIKHIKTYIYVPYRLGGTTPSGWDCSGFTQWALEYLGRNIPRTATLQAAGGIHINKNNMDLWKPGDILVYSNNGRINHVALYLGDKMLMHALNSKYGTLIQAVEYYEKWDSRNILTDVRRYI